MRIVYEYSHFGGAEVLQVRHPECAQDIERAIAEATVGRPRAGCESAPHDGHISPGCVREQFTVAFRASGFRELREDFTITLPNSEISIAGAFRQIDFVKDNVLVEVQFGKYASMFYDMAKLQYFFNENKADVGVEIVPCYALHKQMSTGVSYGEQLVYDIERLKRHFPAVPVKIILIDAESPA